MANAALNELNSKTHTEQGIWWLNGFWKDPVKPASGYAEEVWKNVHLMIEIEAGRPKMYGSKVWDVKEGCDLDDFKAHNFLEKCGETLTVQALRKKLKDLDVDNNKKMAFTEYMIGKYNKTIADVVNSPQGGQADAEKLAAAKAAVDHASASLNAAVAQEQTSVDAAKAAQNALWASEAAEKELSEAVAALEAEEKALSDRKAGFQAKIDDASLSAMKKSMAVNELAQLEAEDPLPLRKAKITQGAALKRAEKARKLAAEESAKAEAAAAAAAAAKVEAEAAFAAAQAQLDDLKKKGDGIAQGAVWWMDRELSERKKFMPRKK